MCVVNYRLLLGWIFIKMKKRSKLKINGTQKCQKLKIKLVGVM